MVPMTGVSRLALVFDLDGTLIDSRESIATACNHALVGLGHVPLPERVVRGYVGDGSKTLMARALGAGASEADIAAALVAFLRYYEAHPAEGTTWMPGAREALDALADHPAALVTNKPRSVTLRVLAAMGMAERFVAVVAGGDGPLKPDPAPIVTAMRAMGSTADNTWVIGDGTQDVAAGRAAGCRTIAVRGGFTDDAKLRDAGADVIVASLNELLPLVHAAL